MGWGSTVLEAAWGNTGSFGHLSWLCLPRLDRTTPGCTPASVEHWIAFEHAKPGSSIAWAAVVDLV